MSDEALGREGHFKVEMNGKDLLYEAPDGREAWLFFNLMDDETEHPDGPWRGGRLWVLSLKCSTCIFRPGNLMHLQEGRVEQMVESCIAEDTVIPCHKTLDGPRSICRGFYDRHRGDIVTLRLATAMDVLDFDDPPVV